MTLRQWLINLARQLSDYTDGDTSQQFVHWPIELLLSYYNEAMCAIASAKPADYVTTVVMKLSAGATQSTSCSLVGDITEFVDCEGNHISYITQTKKIPTWNSRACAGDGYTPSSVYKSSATTFEVFPPVPSGESYYVKVKCVKQPSSLSLADLDGQTPPCKYEAALTQWALFRALSGDSDTTAATTAQLHYKAFFDLLGLQMKADLAFNGMANGAKK